ncbi:inositol monophosphatase [Erwiniaceae bacterium BAC15a-03b]|uniref:Nus factor SuhB n=1 Tax=Winslowiella arboricola TaxID=2978220 RepID=A0A9J6PHD5_9GAMM|nr:inositol monophosphatase [Winslowiella arboricola]MCU5772046.1 inositol monophosphatase [Winslowiella arboricola]MCU5776118.1 inositol monophosphatase [Winslowiella arboricola]
METLTPLEIDARYHFACEVAQAAANRAFGFYQQRNQLEVEHKGQDLQDVVSIADRTVEELARSMIRSRFPDDDFLGEESGGGNENARCTWVVDPIDGTSCFLNGLHNWCVSIGIVVDGEPVIGVVYDPNHRELFRARAGQGAYVNDAPMCVHSGADLRAGVMGVGTSHRVTPETFVPFISALLHEGGMFIRNGSGALMTAWVAAGRLIGYYEPHMNAWDSLPGIVLVREAGGVTNDFLANHGLLNGNPLLMASKTLYPQLTTMITQKLT